MMRKILLLLLICLLTIPVSYANARLYMATRDIKVRKRPGLTYQVVATIKKSEDIIVTDIYDGWGKVTYNERVGYIPMKYIANVVDNTPPPPPEKPDTDDALDPHTLMQLGVVVVALLCLQAFHDYRNKRRSKAAAPGDSKPKHKPVYWFYCKSCKQKVNAEKKPANHYCPKADGHTWISLGEAGNINYHCRHCDITVRTKKEPSTHDCPGGTPHIWTDLGTFGISVLVAKEPPTVNCANTEAHAWKEL
jgi:predicted RNA-binding Zn-ribbon protein involved in translation (DUF1610 family)